MITHETRRQSYMEIQSEAPTRRAQCLEALEELELATANEIAEWIENEGYANGFNRNYAHPRLNELVKMEHVEVVKKRQCWVTSKTCAVYQVRG